MKYFAEIDKNNIVLRVVVVESAEYANKLFGGEWVETFQNISNKNYCSKGWIYDPKSKNFYSPKPYNDGWFLDESLKWKQNITNELVNIIPNNIKPKVIITEDNKIYRWNNQLIKWEEQI